MILCYRHRGVLEFPSYFFWTTVRSNVYTPGPCFYYYFV